MKKLSIISAPLLVIAAGNSASAQTERLPIRTDVPEDYSMVHCPNEPATRTMLRNYYVTDNKGFLGPTFFKGLEATGCEQQSGPVTIVEVLERISMGSEPSDTYVAFRSIGTGGALKGKQIFGIVNEEGNNQHPRNALDRWKRMHAAHGVVTASPADKRVYLCPTPKAAMNVIAAIPPVRQKGVNQPIQVRAKEAAIKTNRCGWATGRFRVTAIHSSAFISLGYEVGEHWTALTATDARGKSVGILHDSNLM